MPYVIYGKRIGKPVNGEPIYDKTFRALNYNGLRVNKLADAGAYATREDAQEVLDKPGTKELIDAGLVEFAIRKAK